MTGMRPWLNCCPARCRLENLLSMLAVSVLSSRPMRRRTLRERPKPAVKLTGNGVIMSCEEEQAGSTISLSVRRLMSTVSSRLLTVSGPLSSATFWRLRKQTGRKSGSGIPRQRHPGGRNGPRARSSFRSYHPQRSGKRPVTSNAGRRSPDCVSDGLLSCLMTRGSKSVITSSA